MLDAPDMSFADDLESRLYHWAIGVVRFCRTLPATAEVKEMTSQLRRASTGASANYRASRRARSTKEWIAKIGIVLEELDESDHWLAMMRDSGLAKPPQNLLTECRELRAVLAKSAATARARYR
jgi:four helix bundle protein